MTIVPAMNAFVISLFHRNPILYIAMLGHLIFAYVIKFHPKQTGKFMGGFLALFTAFCESLSVTCEVNPS